MQNHEQVKVYGLQVAFGEAWVNFELAVLSETG